MRLGLKRWDEIRLDEIWLDGMRWDELRWEWIRLHAHIEHTSRFEGRDHLCRLCVRTCVCGCEREYYFWGLCVLYACYLRFQVSFFRLCIKLPHTFSHTCKTINFHTNARRQIKKTNTDTGSYQRTPICTPTHRPIYIRTEIKAYANAHKCML